MSDVVRVALISGMFSLLGIVVTVIPTIIANRKKTQESIKQTTEAMEKRIDKLQTSYDAHVKDYEAAKAASQRYRILRFYDEVCEGRKHSESHFEDILDDIDDYEIYCDSHPNFKNNRGHAAMEHIKRLYPELKANGGFLTHE